MEIENSIEIECAEECVMLYKFFIIIKIMKNKIVESKIIYKYSFL